MRCYLINLVDVWNGQSTHTCMKNWLELTGICWFTFAVVSLLKSKPPGSFLVRDSTSFSGCYALSVKVSEVPPNCQNKPGFCLFLRIHCLFNFSSCWNYLISLIYLISLCCDESSLISERTISNWSEIEVPL